MVGIWLLAPELLRLGAWDLVCAWSQDAGGAILPRSSERALILADGETFCETLFVQGDELGFDLLVPLPNTKCHQKLMASIPDDQFTRHWPGYATATTPFRFARAESPDREYFLLVQRQAEKPGDYEYTGYLCTSKRDEVEALSRDYPDRWHIEEFYNLDQSLGWKRAGTLNLNVRYNQMSLAMLAQAAIHQLREKLPQPYRTWSAKSLADHLFNGIDGDIRVRGDTIEVTYYHGPDCAKWRAGYEGLPALLESEGITPTIPWLYDFKLDFRFK